MGVQTQLCITQDDALCHLQCTKIFVILMTGKKRHRCNLLLPQPVSPSVFLLDVSSAEDEGLEASQTLDPVFFSVC